MVQKAPKVPECPNGLANLLQIAGVKGKIHDVIKTQAVLPNIVSIEMTRVGSVNPSAFVSPSGVHSPKELRCGQSGVVYLRILPLLLH